MRRILAIILLSVAACAAGLARTVGGSSDPGSWQFPTGQSPSQVEYAALVAACQDKVRSTGDRAKINACLTGDYGLRRLP